MLLNNVTDFPFMVFAFLCCNSSIRQFEHEPNMDPSLHAMVEFRNLDKRYRKGNKNVPALSGLNLTLYQNQITSLIGHNGKCAIIASSSMKREGPLMFCLIFRWEQDLASQLA